MHCRPVDALRRAVAVLRHNGKVRRVPVGKRGVRAPGTTLATLPDVSGEEPLIERANLVPALFSEIDEHWACHADEATRDDALALSVLAHVSAGVEGHVLVVGAGHGHSALALGAAARATGRGRVFAIDVYPETDDTPDTDGWSLDSLLKRAGDAQLGAWVLPHFGTAATFAQLMPADFRCRLIHLEAAHACSSVHTDVFLLERLLAPGGWLTVGGAFSGFPGAREALEVFARQRPDVSGWRALSPGLLIAQKLA